MPEGSAARAAQVLTLLLAANEVAPYAKMVRLADVTGSLPPAPVD